MKAYGPMLWLLLLVSCSRDLGIELPYEGPRLVVIAQFSPDRPFSARVDRTYPPTGKSLFDTTFSGATVIVYENNRPLDTLRYARGNTYESARGLKPRPGDRYHLRLAALGFPDAESREEVVPVAPRVLRAEVTKPDDYVVTLNLQDIPDQTNQYSVELTGLYTGKRVFLLVYDLARPDGIVDNCGFRDGSETFFYRDVCFTNQQLVARFSTSLSGAVRELVKPWVPGTPFESPSRLSDRVQIRVRSVTDSYWNYYRTLPNSEGIERSFLQPTTRYGNVRGGYGIVAAYNEQIVVIPVKP